MILTNFSTQKYLSKLKITKRQKSSELLFTFLLLSNADLNNQFKNWSGSLKFCVIPTVQCRSPSIWRLFFFCSFLYKMQYFKSATFWRFFQRFNEKKVLRLAKKFVKICLDYSFNLTKEQMLIYPDHQKVQIILRNLNFNIIKSGWNPRTNSDKSGPTL